MRTSLLKALVTVTIGGLAAVMTGQISNAQELRKDLVTTFFESMSHDLSKDMAKPKVAPVVQEEEFKKQVIRQLVREAIAVIGPENIKDIMKSAVSEATNTYGTKMRTERGRTADTDTHSQSAPPLSVASELLENSAIMNTGKSQGPVANPQALRGTFREKMVGSDALRMLSNRETASESKGFCQNRMALIAHSSNRVHTLTVDQVRKLFSGEYTNWSQVGGADLPVNLLTPTDAAGRLELLLGSHISPSAAAVPYLSFLYVGVAENKGAVGFLASHSMEQIEAVRGRGLIKRIVIKEDNFPPD